MKYLAIVLLLVAGTGCEEDCPEDEKVVDRYEVHENYYTTTVEPVMVCP